MILIADSGSIKTDWAFLNKHEIQYFRTEGLNPRQKTIEEAIDIMQKQVSPHQTKAVRKVLFYGAGCSSVEGQQLIIDAIAQVFPQASAEVSTDLHGAAIGLFGHKAGITAILGTGANCGYWDGKKMKVQPASLGYLLGDEGSGCHIGKLLSEFYLKKNMPEALAQKFEERYGFSQESLVSQLYKQSKPNIFLAKFAYFASENRNDDFIKALLDESFSLFFRDYITKLPHATQIPIKFTGSIASTFETEIKNTAWKFGCQISSVIKSPINGLAEYFKTME